jgi:hypothetical protein
MTVVPPQLALPISLRTLLFPYPPTFATHFHGAEMAPRFRRLALIPLATRIGAHARLLRRFS